MQPEGVFERWDQHTFGCGLEPARSGTGSCPEDSVVGFLLVSAESPAFLRVPPVSGNEVEVDAVREAEDPVCAECDDPPTVPVSICSCATETAVLCRRATLVVEPICGGHGFARAKYRAATDAGPLVGDADSEEYLDTLHSAPRLAETSSPDDEMAPPRGCFPGGATTSVLRLSSSCKCSSTRKRLFSSALPSPSKATSPGTTCQGEG